MSIVKGNMPLCDMAAKAENALNACFNSKRTTVVFGTSKISPWLKKTGEEEATPTNDDIQFNEPPMLLKLIAKDVETLRSDNGGKCNSNAVIIRNVNVFLLHLLLPSAAP